MTRVGAQGQKSTPRVEGPLRWGIVCGFVGALIGAVTPWVSDLFSGHILPSWWLFVCPPSFLAMGMDGFRGLEILTGWFLISVMNAGVYLAAGVLLGVITRKGRT
jgi:hypothetical protein